MVRPTICKTVRLPASRRLIRKKKLTRLPSRRLRIDYENFDISNVCLGDVLFRNRRFGKRYSSFHDLNPISKPFSLTFPEFITFFTKGKRRFAIIKPNYIELLRGIAGELVPPDCSLSPNFNLVFNDAEKMPKTVIKICDPGDMGEEYCCIGTHNAEVILTVYRQRFRFRSHNIVPTAFINFFENSYASNSSWFHQVRKKTIK